MVEFGVAFGFPRAAHNEALGRPTVLQRSPPTLAKFGDSSSPLRAGGFGPNLG